MSFEAALTVDVKLAGVTVEVRCRGAGPPQHANQR